MSLKAVIDKNTNEIIIIVENLKIEKGYIVGSKIYTREFDKAPKMVISQYSDNIIIKDINIYEIGKDIDELKQIVMIALYSDILVYIKYTNETIKNITDEEKSVIKLIENKIVNHKIIKEVFGYYPKNINDKKRLIQFGDSEAIFIKNEMSTFKES